MMSALAFGYGVGMAAPEAAIEDLEGAVGRGATSSGPRAAARSQGARPQYWIPYPPPGWTYGRAPSQLAAPRGVAARVARDQEVVPGGETDELAQLRGTGGATCKIPHRGSDERDAVSSEDEPYAYDYDAAGLDPAGQEALSRLQLPDFRVSISKAAIKYVRFLTRTHRGRGLFEAWLKRSGRYVEMIQQTLREWHLPEDLIWVAMIESGFDPTIKSPAGAVGLWQFMRSTGEVYGLEVNRYHDLRKNPVRATEAAVHHLRDLHQRFGSWDLAFAAYNMGYEQLLARIDRHGTTDFTELARRRALPKETSAYVPKIVAAALVANNLERYGFGDVELYDPVHYSELSVPGGTALSTIAEAAGIRTGELRKLNPHIRTEHVPPGAEYVVMVPPETLSRARAALPAMIDQPVAKNDADILLPDRLARFDGPKSKRLRHNAWTEDENLLRHLPKPKRRSLRSMLSGKKEEPEREEDAAIAEGFAPRRAGRKTIMYRVGGGDSLIQIAKQFAVDVEDLASDNGLEPDAMLREGALLKILVKPEVLKGLDRRKSARGRSKRRKKG